MRRFASERGIPRVGSLDRGQTMVAAVMRRQAALLRFFGCVADMIGTWSLTASERLRLWGERKRQRRALATMNDHMLKDMGLTRGDAEIEIGKRFWQD